MADMYGSDYITIVDEEEQALLSQVLMAYPVHHGLVAGLAVALVGTDTVVGILAPQELTGWTQGSQAS